MTVVFVLSGTDIHPNGAEEGPETAGRYKWSQQPPSRELSASLSASLSDSLSASLCVSELDKSYTD